MLATIGGQHGVYQVAVNPRTNRVYAALTLLPQARANSGRQWPYQQGDRQDPCPGQRVPDRGESADQHHLQHQLGQRGEPRTAEAAGLAVRFLDGIIDVSRVPLPELEGPARSASRTRSRATRGRP